MASTDADLTVRVRPPALTVLPGQAGFATVEVHHRKRRWKGQSENRPFQVSVATDDEGPLLLDAGSVQKPVLAGAAGKVLAGGAGAAAARRRAVVRPAQAGRRVGGQGRRGRNPAEEVANDDPDGSGGGGDPDAATPDGLAASGSTVAGSATRHAAARPPRPRATVPPIANFNEPLELTTVLNRTGTARYTVPSGKILLITDLFVQNPQGDRGRVDVFVSGGAHAHGEPGATCAPTTTTCSRRWRSTAGRTGGASGHLPAVRHPAGRHQQRPVPRRS